MRNLSRAAFVTLGLALPAYPLVAHAAPQGLYGKSVVVSWLEMRSQRIAGESAFKPVSLPFTYTVYVSSEGRPFKRLTSVSSTRQMIGSVDRVGSGGTGPGGSTGSIQFTGNSIVSSVSAGDFGRRIQITLDSGFGSCSAHVISGMSAGKKIVSTRSVASGATVEFESVSAGSASCSVQAGNAFAN